MTDQFGGTRLSGLAGHRLSTQYQPCNNNYCVMTYFKSGGANLWHKTICVPSVNWLLSQPYARLTWHVDTLTALRILTGCDCIPWRGVTLSESVIHESVIPSSTVKKEREKSDTCYGSPELEINFKSDRPNPPLQSPAVPSGGGRGHKTKSVKWQRRNNFN